MSLNASVASCRRVVGLGPGSLPYLVRLLDILRQVVSNVELADTRAQVCLSTYTDFENFTTCKSASHLGQSVTVMLDQVIAWGEAWKALRAAKSG